uniref:Uncharacterized protein n=1 Tax=Arundo donax TaxID=35708 RepID=A0A0A8YNC7_ARUDO
MISITHQSSTFVCHKPQPDPCEISSNNHKALSISTYT